MLSRLKILFLCTGNSCRSQMAEAWARYLHADRLEPHSAGTAPQGLDPMAVQVMSEAGIDMSSQSPKHVDVLVDIDFDWVVTVCDRAHESCPVLPGAKRSVHHGFDDPPRLAQAAATHHDALQHYRRVRDQIRDFVLQLPGRLIDSQ